MVITGGLPRAITAEISWRICPGILTETTKSFPEISHINALRSLPGIAGGLPADIALKNQRKFLKESQQRCPDAIPSEVDLFVRKNL